MVLVLLLGDDFSAYANGIPPRHSQRLLRAVRGWSFSFQVFADDRERGEDGDDDTSHQRHGLKPRIDVPWYRGD